MRGLVTASVLSGTVLPVLFMLVGNALPGVWQQIDEGSSGAALRFTLHALAAALAVAAWIASSGVPSATRALNRCSASRPRSR